MTDRPIIFSAPMVRALLDGRKSQTRRLARADCQTCGTTGDRRFQEARGRLWPCKRCAGRGWVDTPWATTKPGDRLWVREAHWRLGQWLHEGGRWHFEPTPDYGPVFHTLPRAKGTRFAGEHGWWQRPSIFHERQHSRLTLTVTDVRVQRLQEISEADARAEGVPTTTAEHTFRKVFRDPAERAAERLARFADLWDSLHGPAAWDANPWVAALTFTVERWNIDATHARAKAGEEG